ncbi:MAG TPA: hypothetical protein PLO23_05580 [Alphaproteobacteria bacterium]|nr:hypothetical protein [Alphaproteobacteria bacterium]
MKRIYTDTDKTPARRALEQETLLTLRSLRARMKQDHPGMLEAIQSRYQAAQKPSDEIPIDREKNMETIALFLKLRGMTPGDLLH